MNSFYDHIEDYIFNRLSGDERAKMEAAMIEDDNLKRAVDEAKLARELSLGFLEDEVRATLEEGSNIQSIQKGSSHSVRRFLAIAASIFLLVVAAYWYTISMKEKTWNYAEVYAEVGLPGERGRLDSLSLAVQAGFDGDVILASRVIRNLDTSQIVKSYWIAELYAKAAQGDSILAYLPAPSSEALRRDRILYLEILAHIQKADWEKVRQLREQLPEDMDDYYLKLLD